MKILIISGCYLPIPSIMGGAVENLVQMYIDENEKKYFNKIDVYSGVSDSKIDLSNYKNAKFHFLKRKSKFSLSNIFHKSINKFFNIYTGEYIINKIIREVKKSKVNYDVILCENEPLFTIKLKKSFPNSKIYLHLHNDILTPETKMYNSIMKSCDKVIAVSNYIKERIDNDKKVDVVYNGIDLSIFDKEISKKEKESILKKYNISHENFIYIYVGRIVPEKGIKELVVAFNKLNEKYKNIKLLVVGSTFFKNAGTSKFYEELVNMNNKNIIYTGYIDNALLPLLYSISNVQVTPSIINESFGLSALEAIAQKKLVISTEAGGLKEVLKYGNSIIVNKENLEKELIKAMELALLNYTKLNQNKIKSLKEFSMENYSEKLNELLITKE